jgi:DNA polymerase III delta prime subunit
MNYKLVLTKLLDCSDLPNLILSGTDKIDKLDILMDILKQKDKSTLLLLEKHGIKWNSNMTYKIFDMNEIQNKNTSHFFDILNEIISSKNYYTNGNRIVVLNNFDNIHINIQNKFRVIFEKYRSTTVFILITSRFNSIIDPLISRFLMIRVNDETPKEKRTISRVNLNDLSYENKSIVYDKIYKLSDRNEIIYYSKFHDGILMNHSSIYDKIYRSIISIDITKETLCHIKDLAYKIEKYNIKNIHKELLLLFLNDLTLSFSVQLKICKLVAECEYKYHSSFNTILSIENFILSLICILTSRQEIDRD